MHQAKTPQFSLQRPEHKIEYWQTNKYFIYFYFIITWLREQKFKKIKKIKAHHQLSRQNWDKIDKSHLCSYWNQTRPWVSHCSTTKPKDSAADSWEDIELTQSAAVTELTKVFITLESTQAGKPEKRQHKQNFTVFIFLFLLSVPWEFFWCIKISVHSYKEVYLGQLLKAKLHG